MEQHILNCVRERTFFLGKQAFQLKFSFGSPVLVVERVPNKNLYFANKKVIAVVKEIITKTLVDSSLKSALKELVASTATFFGRLTISSVANCGSADW